MGWGRVARVPGVCPHRPLFRPNAGLNLVTSLVFQPRSYLFGVARVMLKQG